MREKRNKKKRERCASLHSVGLVSLGCAKNLVDSEKILGNLATAGFAICADDADADIIIINTCSFVQPAREESLRCIKEFCRRKKEGKLQNIIVTGCLAQQEGADLFKKVKGVDAAVSFKYYPDIASILERLLIGEKRITAVGLPEKFDAEVSRLLLTFPHYAYLRVAEGCDNTCTFCTIPSIKGKYRSKPLAEIMKEANELTGAGVKELILIAQDTAAYGKDFQEADSTDIATVLKNLCSIDSLKWIRLLYANPESISDKLIEVIASQKKVVKYIDIPIQHINDSVLRRMGRKSRCNNIEKLISKLRSSIPDIFIRTTVITGFPGETENEFHELLEFIKTVRFERLGAFAYSPEKGTPSSKMNLLPDKLCRKRREEVMRTQQEIVFELNRSLIGKKIESIIDFRSEGEYPFVGRTEFDAPEIDSSIYIKGQNAVAGKIVSATITGYRGYDLTGEIED
ncbi:MAG: 30S ribosomal protein S12 methylthiotransferase RimO [Planctomycetota bacterium]